MRRLLRRDFVASDLVIPINLNRQPRTNLAQPLDEVVGKRVVVVDQEDHGVDSVEIAEAIGRTTPTY
jgi:hypothetical protein